jgi:CxxC motif-containing protein (DUF1111 family)
MTNGKRKVVTISTLDVLTGLCTFGLALVIAKLANDAAKNRYAPVYETATCDLCGFDIDTGRPMRNPRSSNPDLIRLGAERIRREQEQAAAAAADYFHEHGGRR